MKKDTNTKAPVTFTTDDGVDLSGILYQPAQPSRLMVLMAGATAVPQGFYRRFAEHLTASGYSVLTFDYRGVGASRTGELKGFHASMLDWSVRDLGAALDWCLARGPTSVVGHSLGGQAFGLLERANEATGLYTFGSGAGWLGYMPLSERPRVWLLWNVLGPILTRWLGYMPGSKLGLGEDLPLGVYADWKRWCASPRFWFDDVRFPFEARYNAVTRPIVAANAEDDRWAPPVSVRELMKPMTQTNVSFVTLKSAAHPIGHMGYFRAQHQAAIWPAIVKWLENHRTSTAMATE
jgi:predicted alpha/beta hydrolase